MKFTLSLRYCINIGAIAESTMIPSDFSYMTTDVQETQAKKTGEAIISAIAIGVILAEVQMMGGKLNFW